MTLIKTRIRIRYESENGREGRTFYIQNLDELRKFELEHDPEFTDHTVMDVGTILQVPNEGKLEVTRMYTYFLDKEYSTNDAPNSGSISTSLIM